MKRDTWPIYKFDPFLLNVRERKLTSNGEEIPLTPKVFDTLLVLIENGGHIVTKREMFEQIWSGIYVEEASLAQNIFTLRRALGEHAASSQYIETVRQIGYRFIAPIDVYEEGNSSPRIASPPSLPTIAVLPFDSLT